MKVKRPSRTAGLVAGALVGLASVVAGVYLNWGLGWALLVGGAAALALCLTVDV